MRTYVPLCHDKAFTVNLSIMGTACCFLVLATTKRMNEQLIQNPVTKFMASTIYTPDQDLTHPAYTCLDSALARGKAMGLHTASERELCDGRVVIYQRTDTMSPVWQCRIAFPGQPYIRRSLKTRNESDAVKLAMTGIRKLATKLYEDLRYLYDSGPWISCIVYTAFVLISEVSRLFYCGLR